MSSPVFIAAYQVQQNAGLSQYLIQGQAPLKMGAEAPSDGYEVKSGGQRTRDKSNDHAVIEILLLKLQNFKEAWIALSKERASNITADTIQIMASLIVLTAILPTLLDIEVSQVCKDLLHGSRQVWSLLCRFLELSGDVASENDTIVAATVSGIRGFKSIVAEDPVLQALSVMLSSLLTQLHRNNPMAAEHGNDDMDMLDPKDSFLSHSAQPAPYESPLSGTRQYLPFATNKYSFKLEVMLQLHMCLSDAEAAKIADEHGIPSTINYLMGLGPEDLLASHSSMSLFLRSSNLTVSDACRLLKSLHSRL